MAIQRLILRDFVIVRELELDLTSGFTALTGETGAGKSILIDAIQIALGERANTSIVRDGATKADIAIEFDRLPAIDAWLEAAGFETEDQLLVRRTIDTTGKSRAWINGSAATAAQLRELADHLVDIHGQHAWAMLTRPDAVRDLLDAYAQIDKQPLATAWYHWRTAYVQLEVAKNSAGAQNQERERLQWQISEVEKLHPLENEWGELNTEHSRLTNAQNLLDAAHLALEVLSGGESDSRHHAQSQIQSALQALQAQSHIEQGFQSICDELSSSLEQIKDAVHTLQAYLRKTDLDPARLAQLDSRMVDWLSLARRFKCSPHELHGQLMSWHEALTKLEALGNIEELEKTERASYFAFENSAKLVSKKRQEAAPRLALAVTAAMQELGMKGGKFEVPLTQLSTPGSHGFESVEFLVAAHSGTLARPVGKVASGGELSRIALAIAVTTSKLGNAPTLIFDEVDAGIGGATAQTVGRLMRQLGQDRQVLAVTHLPQVASYAHQHGVVSKTVEQGNQHAAAPCSTIVMVTNAERIHEIARMLGSEPITDAALTHAAQMLEVT